MRKVIVLKFVFLFTLIIAFSCNTKKNTDATKEETVEEMEPTTSAVWDNSKNALDWSGTYTGTIPCADCDGIETSVTLFKSGAYTRTQKYAGKSNDQIKDNGKFKWNDQGAIVTLTDKDGNSQQYQVGENVLFHLDTEGKRISGDLSKNYQLMKNHNDGNLEDKKWVLVELMGQKVEYGKDDKPIHITFNGELGQMTGYNGCNLLVGPYTLKPGLRIEVGMMANTLMACKNMDTATKFMEILQKMDNYSIAENALSLNKARMAPMARLEFVKEEE